MPLNEVSGLEFAILLTIRAEAPNESPDPMPAQSRRLFSLINPAPATFQMASPHRPDSPVPETLGPETPGPEVVSPNAQSPFAPSPKAQLPFAPSPKAQLLFAQAPDAQIPVVHWPDVMHW